MGRPLIEVLGEKSAETYGCDSCWTPFCARKYLLETDFRGETGTAYLFSKTINLVQGVKEKKQFMTGTYLTRCLNCKRCGKKVGWFYEYAFDEDQRSKEGKYVLELELINIVDQEYVDESLENGDGE